MIEYVTNIWILITEKCNYYENINTQIIKELLNIMTQSILLLYISFVTLPMKCSYKTADKGQKAWH